MGSRRGGRGDAGRGRNTQETQYAHGFAEGGGTLNTLYAMARDSYTNAMTEVRSVRELLQTQTQRIDTNELQGQATSTRANQMQQAIADIVSRLANVESTMGMRLMAGTYRTRHTRDVTESKPVNGLAVFSGKETESFRDWSMKVVEIMEKLKPGSREILREIDRTKKDDWDLITHEDVFSDSQNMKDLFKDLNADMWWI